MSDSTRRFSSRVDNYVRYRPRYPVGLIELLRDECNLTNSSTVADVGSGTGILSELFLANGNTVFGVEPNAPMRHAAERLLATEPRFHSVDGTAEHTGLPAECADFVTAGQAFHWFDSIKARHEFKRILKPAGWVVLVWNERAAKSGFGSAYEDVVMEYATGYEAVNQRSMSVEALTAFFTNGFSTRTLSNSQRFDFAGLKGRLLSSSYAPEPAHPRYDGLITALRNIFDAHQERGKVMFEYNTNVYYGRV